MGKLTHNVKRVLRQSLSPSAYQRMRHAKQNWVDGFSYRTFSQTGEDMILRQVYLGQSMGFYVDVGAHHPRRFSNTWYFYQLGWRGINVDALPGSMTAFQAQRPRDTNLELGVGETEAILTFHVFQEGALNTFDAALAEQRVLVGTPGPQKINVSVKPLAAILNQHLPKNTKIDFLTVDVEGLDLQVLRSNDWGAYRPRCVVAESDGFDLNAPDQDPLYRFMREQGYRLYAKTIASVFFLEGLQD